VTLGRLVLGGANGAPEVVLSNLVWTARQAMGKPGTASFAIGSVTVAGQVLPIPADFANILATAVVRVTVGGRHESHYTAIRIVDYGLAWRPRAVILGPRINVPLIGVKPVSFGPEISI